MCWIVVLLFVPSFVDGFKTFGNLEDNRVTPVVRQKCVLPQYPENGSYIVINKTDARPEDVFDDISLLMYTSDEYFELELLYFTCTRGNWTRESIKRVPWPIKSKDGDLKNQGKSPDTKSNPEYCKLPSYPEHGFYIVAGDADAKPGDECTSVNLEYMCEEDYNVSGKNHVFCKNGTWYDETPECIEMKKLPKDSKVPSRILMNNESDTCMLPPQPEHGVYVIIQRSDVGSGNNYALVELSFLCHIGYGIVGSEFVQCLDGVWSHEVPKCVGVCTLSYIVGVYYLCKEQDSDKLSTFCPPYKPYGEEVLPQCKAPYYRPDQELPPMKCIYGKWNYTPTCLPECGIQNNGRQITNNSRVSGGRPTIRKEVPWHVGIYNKLCQPYKQICSGSIISPKLVITAAHCFWDDLEEQEPASRFAVAAGKLYRPWETPYDFGAQFSDVNNIVIPKRFRGAQTNFQDDIAIMYLSKSFVFDMGVWPVCIDFDLDLDRKQLAVGNLGKVAGWGLTDEDGKPSPILQIVELPYVEVDKCIVDASLDFRAYITSDKICAGYTNGTALCMGDSGGGLAFAEKDGCNKRYYLRGIASTAPSNQKKCNTHAVTTFTQILAHEHFIKDHLNLSSV